MRKTVIGVIGGGDAAPPSVIAEAEKLGRLIASKGWILLNGGRNAGAMNGSAKGAHEAGGLTIGLLPEDSDRNASAFLDVRIVTSLGSARNNVLVLSSDLVIACPGAAGTLSEVALALKAHRTVVLMGFDLGMEFHEAAGGRLHVAKDAADAVAIAESKI